MILFYSEEVFEYRQPVPQGPGHQPVSILFYSEEVFEYKRRSQ